jgi:hypothetical protein
LPLHYTRTGYTFTADAHSLTITPGPKPVTLQRSELGQSISAMRHDKQRLIPHVRVLKFVARVLSEPRPVRSVTRGRLYM